MSYFCVLTEQVEQVNKAKGKVLIFCHDLRTDQKKVFEFNAQGTQSDLHGLSILAARELVESSLSDAAGKRLRLSCASYLLNSDKLVVTFKF